MLKRLPPCIGIRGFDRSLSSWTFKDDPSHISTPPPRTERGNPRHHAAGQEDGHYQNLSPVPPGTLVWYVLRDHPQCNGPLILFCVKRPPCLTDLIEWLNDEQMLNNSVNRTLKKDCNLFSFGNIFWTNFLLSDLTSPFLICSYDCEVFQALSLVRNIWTLEKKPIFCWF